MWDIIAQTERKFNSCKKFTAIKNQNKLGRPVLISTYEYI
nr:MAG TPA: hypothetical protein [Bacteriophage sp.]